MITFSIVSFIVIIIIIDKLRTIKEVNPKSENMRDKSEKRNVEEENSK